jgi:AcrR family transcriptional regulator
MTARPKLTPDMIVETALNMLNAEGEKSFSMRKLASELQVDPMAIYHHHANKSALLHAVMEAMMARCAVPNPSGDWRQDIHALCSGIRQLAQDNPGAFRVFETYEHWLTAEHRLQDAILLTLTRAGFDDVTAVRGMRVLLVYTEAFAVDEISGWLDPEELDGLADRLDAESYPTMNRLADAVTTIEPDAEFAFGLTVLLDGLETALHRQTGCT